MIFPILSGVLSFLRAPVTWMLFFLNLAVYVATVTSSENHQKNLEAFVQDDVFTEEQGYIYARFIEAQKNRYPAGLQFLSERALAQQDMEKRRLLGGMAMRDTQFLREAPHLQASGDVVAFQWWKKRFQEISDIRDAHPSYGLGVTQTEADITRWLTYQFAHSGTAHFAGNMLFFLIFASSLELLIGSLGLLCVYLASGIFAALVFSLMNETSAIPLIGASGAVSGVMALFCVLMWNRGVRYAFFLMVPKRGYAGMIYLPAWLTLLLWFLSDLAGHLATPSELGGVAYSAHLGGEFCGLVIGLTLWAWRRSRGEPLMPAATAVDTKPVFTRYV